MSSYTEKSISSLNWREHIRARPGMYIGKLGDGSQPGDGIYVLVKEIMDNAIDEHLMGCGKKILISRSAETISIRDFGRGIPLGKVVSCVSKMNTGAKYHGQSFQKSVGLNGVGTKAVNALSKSFYVASVRDGQQHEAWFQEGKLTRELRSTTKEQPGTLVKFTPDTKVFGNYTFDNSHLTEMIRHYSYLNTGLKLYLDGKVFRSRQGLHDHLSTQINHPLYPICHFNASDWEVAFTHTDVAGAVICSFVNGQHTPMGGSHEQAFRDVFMKQVREFYGENFEAQDIKQGFRASICIRMQEPLFESQTKTRLGSRFVRPGGPTIRVWLDSQLSGLMELKLHQHPEIAEAMAAKIRQNQKSRLAMQGAHKVRQSRFKRSEKYNKKLRDCKVHYHPRTKDGDQTMIFITEGDSASGSITKSRDPRYQAVFSLRGKPLNSFHLDKEVALQNEELHLLTHALRLEQAAQYGTEYLRYKKIILATDADVDGMHIRLLLLTFFLHFYWEVVRDGFLYILETPLFRVRDGKKTLYCYSEQQRDQALKQLSSASEVTRFKGLGEISPKEFQHFIGPSIKLTAVTTGSHSDSRELLPFYMGGSSPEKKEFILKHLQAAHNKG